MNEVYEFLKSAETYYLATMEGNQPRVRPFGTVAIFEDKLYIQTGKEKNVSKQLHINSKAEICAMKDGSWIRIASTLIADNRIEAKQNMLDDYPELQDMYSAEDENTEVWYLTNAKATINSFNQDTVEINF